jgi:hypothetical protein|tara:strand:+ start:132 stop:410 length:279 start_codon:yes stop_codon:yes gene_type:complete
MNRIEMIKAAAEKGEIRKAIGNVAIRKKSIKEEMKLHKKLTRAMKKAGHQAPSSLEAFRPEVMYYSDKETQDFIAGSSIMETYEAMRSQDDY